MTFYSNLNNSSTYVGYELRIRIFVNFGKYLSHFYYVNEKSIGKIENVTRICEFTLSTMRTGKKKVLFLKIKTGEN